MTALYAEMLKTTSEPCPMRILLANPNTTQAVTDAITTTARAVAGPGTEIIPATARFGAAIIGTRSEMAIAEHACLSLLAAESPGCDAVIIGASLDSALRAAREMLSIPVLGLTESALHIACLTGVRFGCLTTNARSAATLAEMISFYGLTTRCAAIGTLQTTPQDILRDPEGMEAAILAGIAKLIDQGADCVILIGAVMAGMPARLQARADIPILEGVACAVPLAETLVRLALPKPRTGSLAAPGPRATIGLDAPLAARFTA
jgi:allantoin racemase